MKEEIAKILAVLPDGKSYNALKEAILLLADEIDKLQKVELQPKTPRR